MVLLRAHTRESKPIAGLSTDLPALEGEVAEMIEGFRKEGFLQQEAEVSPQIETLMGAMFLVRSFGAKRDFRSIVSRHPDFVSGIQAGMDYWEPLIKDMDLDAHSGAANSLSQRMYVWAKERVSEPERDRRIRGEILMYLQQDMPDDFAPASEISVVGNDGELHNVPKRIPSDVNFDRYRDRVAKLCGKVPST